MGAAARGSTTVCVNEYNASQQLTKVTRPTGLITEFSYGTNGFLATAVDGNDTQSFRTNSHTWTNGLLLTTTDARGLVTTNSWDALGRLTSVATREGAHEP